MKQGANNDRARRRAARLAAVQALYQIDLTKVDPDAVIAEFKAHRLNKDEDERAPTDADYFTAVVEGASNQRARIDSTVSPFLAEGWAFERLEVVLRAILRAAAFELIGRGDVPARVTITEYVEIARGFFAGKEPGFVNGLLDKLARQLRPEEFTASSGDGGDTQASQGR
jgi:N utilization substance protein B